MANSVSEQNRNLTGRLAKNMEIAKWLGEEGTEWQAIVHMQNMMNADACDRYMSALRHLDVSVVDATIEQRVEAFITAMLKK